MCRDKNRNSAYILTESCPFDCFTMEIVCAQQLLNSLIYFQETWNKCIRCCVEIRTVISPTFITELWPFYIFTIDVVSDVQRTRTATPLIHFTELCTWEIFTTEIVKLWNPLRFFRKFGTNVKHHHTMCRKWNENCNFTSIFRRIKPLCNFAL